MNVVVPDVVRNISPCFWAQAISSGMGLSFICQRVWLIIGHPRTCGGKCANRGSRVQYLYKAMVISTRTMISPIPTLPLTVSMVDRTIGGIISTLKDSGIMFALQARFLLSFICGVVGLGCLPTDPTPHVNSQCLAQKGLCYYLLVRTTGRGVIRGRFPVLQLVALRRWICHQVGHLVREGTSSLVERSPWTSRILVERIVYVRL